MYICIKYENKIHKNNSQAQALEVDRHRCESYLSELVAIISLFWSPVVPSAEWDNNAFTTGLLDMQKIQQIEAFISII